MVRESSLVRLPGWTPRRPGLPNAKSGGRFRRSGMKRREPSPGVRHADFEALYQRHNREVWASAFARRMDSHAALDIMQEAFARLWQQWEDGTEILNPRAW